MYFSGVHVQDVHVNSISVKYATVECWYSLPNHPTAKSFLTSFL